MSIIRAWKKKELSGWASNLDNSQITLYGVIINIIIFSIVELLVGLFWVDKYISFIFGITIGSIVSIMLVRNMYKVIEKSIVQGESIAESMVRKGAIIRMLLVIVVFLCAIVFKRYINVYALAISIFSLKFAAYLEPFTNKYFFTRYIAKGR